MDRRDFLRMATSGSNFRARSTDEWDDRQGVTAGLEEHPGLLTRADALHLLRRFTFGPTHDLLAQIEGKSAAEAVDLLLGPVYDPDTNPEEMPQPPGDWVDASDEDPLEADIITKNQIESRWETQHDGLRQWWVNLMHSESLPAREKMTLFWSGHFTTEFTFDDSYSVPALLYRQNQLIRQDRLGDLKKFVEDITLDGAMLAYLGGELNVKGNPNENYARELLELYTTGLGWYSEAEVQAAARVLTGWKASKYNSAPAPRGMYNSWFLPDDHDITSKELLGGIIAARDEDFNTEVLVRRDEIRGVIDLIFELERNDGEQHAVSRFIGEKLYHYFIYSKPLAPPEDFMLQLQQRFIDNNFNMRPVMAAILRSAHFYEPDNRGVQIKTPAEFMVGFARQLGATAANIGQAMAQVEQDLYDPRDVSGWDGYRAWISTKTYPLRANFARELIRTLADADLAAWAKRFSGFDDADMLTSAVEEFLLPRPVSPERHTAYVDALLTGDTKDYEWPEIILDADPASAALRLRSLLTAISRAPDFHLC